MLLKTLRWRVLRVLTDFLHLLRRWRSTASLSLSLLLGLPRLIFNEMLNWKRWFFLAIYHLIFDFSILDFFLLKLNFETFGSVLLLFSFFPPFFCVVLGWVGTLWEQGGNLEERRGACPHWSGYIFICKYCVIPSKLRIFRTRNELLISCQIFILLQMYGSKTWLVVFGIT